MGSEPPSKIRCPICSRLFLASRLVGHLVREHPECIPELLASYKESLDASTNERRVFSCTSCKRVFYTEAELTRHWYGRHAGRSTVDLIGRPNRHLPSCLRCSPSSRPCRNLLHLQRRIGRRPKQVRSKLLGWAAPPGIQEPTSFGGAGAPTGAIATSRIEEWPGVRGCCPKQQPNP